MVHLLLFSIALATAAPLAAAAGELPEPEPPIVPGFETGGLDPATAPLPLLSALRGFGREGASRIGRVRSSADLGGRDEIAALLGIPEGEVDRRLRPSGSPLRAGFRTRWEQKRGGARALHAAEVRAGPLAAGFLVERDAGERRWNDLALAGVSWSGEEIEGVAGDLRVRLGSGLLVGTHEPFGPPSGFGTLPRGRVERYRSRAENRAHRGVGIRLRRRGEWILLLTSTVRDARTDEEGRVSSFDDAGLHRTPEERSRKDRSGERIAALRWEGGRGGARLGLTAAAARFDPPLGGGDLSRKPHAFRGSRLSAASVDLRIGGGRFLGEGEAALSSGGGGGARMLFRAAARGWKGVLRVRRFGTGFHAPRSVAYHRVGPAPNGEGGVILLAGGPVPGEVTVRARLHRYATDGRTWRSGGPVFGTEGSIRVERRFGPLRIFAAAGSSVKSEVLGGVRREGGSAALGAGTILTGGPWRFRTDLRSSASLSPGGSAVRRARGVSFYLTRRLGPGSALALSLVLLPEGERVLLFPVPHLPGTAPAAWFGGGRERAGVRAALSGLPLRAVHGAVVFGPEGAAFEISFGTGGG